MSHHLQTGNTQTLQKLSALALHAPNVLAAAQQAMAESTTKPLPLADQTAAPQVTRFDAHTFSKQPDISIDYAVMERATNVVLVPARFGWSDVGAWPAVAQAHTPDASGNTLGAADNTEWADILPGSRRVQ